MDRCKLMGLEFPHQFVSDSWLVGCGGADHAPHMAEGLGDCGRGFSRRAFKTRRARPRRPKFLEALHYFTVRNITWRTLPAACGNNIASQKRTRTVLGHRDIGQAKCRKADIVLSTSVVRAREYAA
jgi:hypothetical protein